MLDDVRLQNGKGIQVRFLKPVQTVLLAARSVSTDLRSLVQFSPDPKAYASSCGLLNQLNQQYLQPTGSGKQGRTYSALTRLQHPGDVEFCNSVINNMIREQFASFPRRSVSAITHVVGELHDNVASHAGGCGFSAAQKFGETLQFAIADTGVGMPNKVRRIHPGLADAAAVKWCLEKGNTTAAKSDPMAQRLPEDCVVSPYPARVSTFSGDNNHLGLGLWQLRELVQAMGGELTVASGNANLMCRKGSIFELSNPYSWNGVVIDFTLRVQDIAEIDPIRRRKLDELAERLGLFE